MVRAIEWTSEDAGSIRTSQKQLHILIEAARDQWFDRFGKAGPGVLDMPRLAANEETLEHIAQFAHVARFDQKPGKVSPADQPLAGDKPQCGRTGLVGVAAASRGDCAAGTVGARFAGGF